MKRINPEFYYNSAKKRIEEEVSKSANLKITTIKSNLKH